jgi:hypothetical protein
MRNRVFGVVGRDPETSELILMLRRTFATGVVDAVGYLGLDK